MPRRHFRTSTQAVFVVRQRGAPYDDAAPVAIGKIFFLQVGASDLMQALVRGQIDAIALERRGWRVLQGSREDGMAQASIALTSSVPAVECMAQILKPTRSALRIAPCRRCPPRSRADRANDRFPSAPGQRRSPAARLANCEAEPRAGGGLAHLTGALPRRERSSSGGRPSPVETGQFLSPRYSLKLEL